MNFIQEVTIIDVKNQISDKFLRNNRSALWHVEIISYILGIQKKV